jgi:hypothetical protein
MTRRLGWRTKRDVMTLEHRENMSRSLRGAKNPRWVGLEATYRTVHTRLQAYRPAEPCLYCGATEGVQWAYNHKEASELRRSSDGLAYSTRPEDYIPLCDPCHRRFDQRTHCRRGHAYDEVNTYISHSGWRKCRACNRERMRRVRQERKS